MSVYQLFVRLSVWLCVIKYFIKNVDISIYGMWLITIRLNVDVYKFGSALFVYLFILNLFALLVFLCLSPNKCIKCHLQFAAHIYTIFLFDIQYYMYVSWAGDLRLQINELSWVCIQLLFYHFTANSTVWTMLIHL